MSDLPESLFRKISKLEAECAELREKIKIIEGDPLYQYLMVQGSHRLGELQRLEYEFKKLKSASTIVSESLGDEVRINMKLTNRLDHCLTALKKIYEDDSSGSWQWAIAKKALQTLPL